jgi:hypothetical protein
MKQPKAWEKAELKPGQDDDDEDDEDANPSTDDDGTFLFAFIFPAFFLPSMTGSSSALRGVHPLFPGT